MRKRLCVRFLLTFLFFASTLCMAAGEGVGRVKPMFFDEIEEQGYFQSVDDRFANDILVHHIQALDLFATYHFQDKGIQIFVFLHDPHIDFLLIQEGRWFFGRSSSQDVHSEASVKVQWDSRGIAHVEGVFSRIDMIGPSKIQIDPSIRLAIKLEQSNASGSRKIILTKYPINTSESPFLEARSIPSHFLRDLQSYVNRDFISIEYRSDEATWAPERLLVVPRVMSNSVVSSDNLDQRTTVPIRFYESIYYYLKDLLVDLGPLKTFASWLRHQLIVQTRPGLLNEMRDILALGDTSFDLSVRRVARARSNATLNDQEFLILSLGLHQDPRQLFVQSDNGRFALRLTRESDHHSYKTQILRGGQVFSGKSYIGAQEDFYATRAFNAIRPPVLEPEVREEGRINNQLRAPIRVETFKQLVLEDVFSRSLSTFQLNGLPFLLDEETGRLYLFVPHEGFMSNSFPHHQDFVSQDQFRTMFFLLQDRLMSSDDVVSPQILALTEERLGRSISSRMRHAAASQVRSAEQGISEGPTVSFRFIKWLTQEMAALDPDVDDQAILFAYRLLHQEVKDKILGLSKALQMGKFIVLEPDQFIIDAHTSRFLKYRATFFGRTIQLAIPHSLFKRHFAESGLCKIGLSRDEIEIDFGVHSRRLGSTSHALLYLVYGFGEFQKALVVDPWQGDEPSNVWKLTQDAEPLISAFRLLRNKVADTIEGNQSFSRFTISIDQFLTQRSAHISPTYFFSALYPQLAEDARSHDLDTRIVSFLGFPMAFVRYLKGFFPDTPEDQFNCFFPPSCLK